ncbi:MAG: translocation protein TolB, partial [Rhodothermales bacterium]|nr:translocation protein TolB [Rhodothermales bacterium]
IMTAFTKLTSFAISILFAIGCGSPESASPDNEMQQDMIAFTSSRTGNYDVFITSVDSDSVINLTDHPATDFGVSWSPAGDQLLFGTDRDGNREIYAMNDNGSDLRNLTNHPGVDTSPAWSPDGSRIAFVSDRDSNSREIYVMNSDGTNIERLTTNERYDESPSWSPDGNQLAFGAVAPSGSDEETLQIFVLDLTTGEETQLTQLAGHNSAPRWSPDGSRIAFYGQVGEGFSGADIFTMNPDGTGMINLTNDAEPDWQPDWSNDGEWIVFSRGPGDPLDIWIMRNDGTERRTVVLAEGRDEQPAWRPASD